MDLFTNLIIESAGKVWVSFIHNWPFLAVSVLIAAVMKLFTNTDKISEFLLRHKNAGVIGATAAAVGTPLCSCGTTAVILGMMASMIPWAPIVAFMVSSPLSSPEGLIYSAGLFGWPFAIFYFVTSIFLGLAGGGIASFLENRGYLKNQNRMNNFNSARKKEEKDPSFFPPQPLFEQTLAVNPIQACCGSELIAQSFEKPAVISTPAPAACGCGTPQKVEQKSKPDSAGSCGCGQLQNKDPHEPVTLKRFFRELFSTGRQLLVMFTIFAFIGFFLNGLIPEGWITALFGTGNSFSVPLAATLGLPFYISSEGSLPLIRGLLDGGMNKGAAMAFLITGAGTSIGAVTGALTIARWRVIALVVGTLWVGAIIAGYAFNLLLTIL
ncbi:MAG: hypothetical protein GYA15_14715 [Leptolinea sp.]|jgi:uncharacterized membrane protein YraQ (UPF0718 family)|nr:hypothetical protein [Leptolinea sp.]